MAPGTVVYACLARNLYLCKAKAGDTPPASVTEFCGRHPTCIRLQREDCDLRLALATDADRGGASFNDRMLFLRGAESVPGGPGRNSLVAVLQADTAAVCAEWARAGQLLMPSWLSLVSKGVDDHVRQVAVARLLAAVQPPMPAARRRTSQAAATLLGAKGRRAVLAGARSLSLLPAAAETGAAMLGNIGEAMGGACGVPILGPLLRLTCSLVQVAAVAIQAAEHGGICEVTMRRCSELAHRLLEEMLETLQLPATRFSARYGARLSSLLGAVELMLEEVEQAIFLGLVYGIRSDKTIRGWSADIDRLHEKTGQLFLQGEMGHTGDRVEYQVSRLLRFPSVSSVGRPDLSPYMVRWKPPHLDYGTYVPGDDQDDRAEHIILGALQQNLAVPAGMAPRLGIWGIGGAGKSSACKAVAASRVVRQLYPGGTVWVQLNQTSSAVTIVEDVMALVCRFCDNADAEALFKYKEDPDFVALAASCIQSVDLERAAERLVVLDDVLDANCALLHTLLGVLPGVTPVLFTTRSQAVAESVPGSTHVRVDALSNADARLLLGRALGRPSVGRDSPFAPDEEDAWVRRAVQRSERHALSLSIVAANIAHRGGAWEEVVNALEARWMDPGFSDPLSGVSSSVRATMDMSLDLLGDEASREAFKSCGVLPTNAKVAVGALAKLWRPQLDRASGAAVQQGLVKGGNGRERAAARVEKLVDSLVRSGLLRRVVDAAVGSVAYVEMHPVIGGYALALLGPDCRATHRRLLGEYMPSLGADVEEGGMRKFRFWEVPDDGYWCDNVARHVAGSGEAAGLPWLLKEEWQLLRVRAHSQLAYQRDVETVAAGLLAIASVDSFAVSTTLQLQREVYGGLAVALRSRIGGDHCKNVDDAVTWASKALGTTARAESPMDWAAAQMNLGNAYADCVRGDKGDNVEAAIKCYDLALEVYKREAAPLEWASTQMNLGLAHAERVRGDKGSNIEAAIKCYDLSLAVRTRNVTPLDWATTQMNMGCAYRNRVRGRNGHNVETAIECYHRSLEVYTREATPLDWARIQMNLGIAYSERVLGDKGGNVEDAIKCYGLSLEVRTREAAPRDWANTQMNLGSAYAERIRGDKGDNMEIAIECYHRALEVYTREAAPLEWAMTQMDLGNAYGDRVRGDKAENIEAAIQCYLLALEVRTRVAAPLGWATTQTNLGVVYADRVLGDKGDNIEAAIKCYDLSLEVRTREAAPTSWARTQVHLGLAYMNRVRGDAGANVEVAISCYALALQVRTRQTAPVEWARTTFNLMVALAKAAQWERALACARSLQQFGTSSPDWAEDEPALDAYVKFLEEQLPGRHV